MLLRQAARSHDQTSIRGVRELRDGALDLGRVAQVERVYLHPERWRHCLDNAELGRARGYGGIPKDRHARHAWCDLLEQLQPFSAQAVFVRQKTGGVTAR